MGVPLLETEVIDQFRGLWSAIPGGTEFWSAIAGAVVGGFIAYIVQMKALREARKQREEDNRRVQQALGNSLLFKMLRIYSDFYAIHRHIEECFEEAAKKRFEGEPWQFLLPLANLPDAINFSSDEMGMLLAQKNNDVFNLVLSMDVIHNSLIAAVSVLSSERRELTQRVKADQAEGNVLSGILNRDQMLTLRPRMIEVNSLIENIRVMAKRDSDESKDALERLQMLLRDKLGLTYTLESNVKQQNAAV